MRKDYMLMTFWTLLFNIVWSYRVVEFSRSLHRAYILTTLQGDSIETCKQECEMRKRCTDAMYQRRSAYCVLTSASRGVQRITKVGAVLMSGFNPDNKAVYGRKIRSPSEICKRNTSTTMVCQVTECGSPSPTTVSDDLYTVGSQLMYSCRSGAKKFTCGPDGVWIHDTKYVDCTDPCGVTGLYVAPQQQLYCDMHNDGGNWMVFQRRYDGSVDFFRNWTDYRDGFGDLHGEFWLGLEQIYQTVRTGLYELRIDMEDFNGTERYAKYDTFKIHGEADSYRLEVAGWTGNCGNSLKYLSGMMFSTKDRDNDLHKRVNCAQRSQGAWWYNDCHMSNLNGRYLHGGHSDTYAANINWKTWWGFKYSLRKTEMKMRRK